MNTKNTLKNKLSNRYVGVRVPFTDKEAEVFASYLKDTGRKVAPLIHKLLIDEMAKDGYRA